MQHMKGSTGIQLHHSYVKPGCKVRGGKQGVDYFNGEGTLLAFVRSDKELCARPNISNIMVRPEGRAICDLPEEETPSGPSRASPEIDHASDADCQFIGEGPRQEKKKTKKQLTEVANARLAVFDKVWGHQNTTASDGKAAEPPRDSSPRPPPRPEGNAGDVIATPAHAENISVSVCTDNDAAASTPRSRTEDSVGVVDGEAFDDNSGRVSLDNSGDETYGPQPKEESEDDEGERDGTDEE
ncbi:hypothetical protein PC112_g16899 [Phytophthora cactorum]|nr:hypothetical protein PC112_g16899 [Phytophthora cactorum]